jgi:hypothetical protein
MNPSRTVRKLDSEPSPKLDSQTCRAARRFCSALALGVALASITPTASAQPSSGPSAAEKETARSLFESGNDKLEAKDYAGAAEDFKGADDIMKVPTTALMAGKALQELGKLVEARDAFVRATLYPAAAAESDVQKDARREAKGLATALEPRIATLTFAIRGPDDDVAVEVTIDGEAVPANLVKHPRKVNPGEHQVVASAPGFLEASQTVTLAEGQEQSVSLSLKPDPSYKPDEPGGGDAPDRPDDGGGLSPLVFVGFGVAGAGLIAGGITGLMAMSKSSDVEDQCTGDVCPASAEEDNDSATTLAHVSTIGFVLAGAGAAVGVVGLLMSGSSDEAPASGGVELEPIVGPGSLGVRGRF